VATRIRTLANAVTLGGITLPANHILTLSDDAAATTLISLGRAVAVADATTALTFFGTDRWVMYKYGTGAIPGAI
jgi:hypothetical protein